MNNIQFRLYKNGDEDRFCAPLREDMAKDWREMNSCLPDGVKISMACGNNLCAIGGWIDEGADCVLWLLCTDLAPRLWLALFKKVKQVIVFMRGQRPLRIWVKVGNHPRAQAFIEKLGFKPSLCEGEYYV